MLVVGNRDSANLVGIGSSCSSFSDIPAVFQGDVIGKQYHVTITEVTEDTSK